MPPGVTFTIRQATLTDVGQIAAAHLDSIRSIGSRHYEPQIVNDWGARVSQELYASAMARGEIFFVAIGDLDGDPVVLGFSSHALYGDEHRTAVYVRGKAARVGIGSALFRAAEGSAIAAAATSIHVDASLAAVEFYGANGFEEVGRGDHRLSRGRHMPCVFMRKNLAAAGSPEADCRR